MPHYLTMFGSLVPTQRHVRTRRVGSGTRGVLADVEDENVCRGGLGGDDEGILWHVARAIDFSLMRYALRDLQLAR